MIECIAGFASCDMEAGVGLALQDAKGRYLFFLAGTRHHCPPGELFYAGIGGHRESNEDWLACAHREAHEEMGSDIEVISSPTTWYIPHSGVVRHLNVVDHPRPFALYEMIHLPGSKHAGEIYRLVIYKARLCGDPKHLPADELRGIIVLTEEQVYLSSDRRPTIAQLIEEGAAIIAEADGETIDWQTRVYPIGTAMALARILHHIREEGA